MTCLRTNTIAHCTFCECQPSRKHQRWSQLCYYEASSRLGHSGDSVDAFTGSDGSIISPYVEVRVHSIVLEVLPNLVIADAAVAERSPPTVDAAVVPCVSPNLRLGGCPNGTTHAHKWSIISTGKKAINWVIMRYTQAWSALTKDRWGQQEMNGAAGRDKKWFVVYTSIKFGMQNDVDVSGLTTHSRIKAEHLNVWHTGSTSPLIWQMSW